MFIAFFTKVIKLEVVRKSAADPKKLDPHNVKPYIDRMFRSQIFNIFLKILSRDRCGEYFYKYCLVKLGNYGEMSSSI